MALSAIEASMPSLDLGQFGALVNLVYQGAKGPAKWPSILEPHAHWVTASKIRTTRVIVRGGFIENAACVIGVSENEVRVLLTQIYAKTGVGSRAQIVEPFHFLLAE